MMKIAILEGVGDTLWSMTKLTDIRAKHNPDKVVLYAKDGSLRRSKEFLESFTFIDEVKYANFPIHPESGAYSREGPYIYLESQKDWVHERDKYDFLLISNGHLERGHRLETWFPEYETDFTIGKQWVFKQEDVDFARRLRDDGKYVVFYPGPYRGNFTDGHNRGHLWTLGDWCSLADSLHENYGLRIILVGASYDKQYSNMLMSRMRDRPFILDFVGETSIGLCYSLCLHSEMIFSYQSGIGIFSVYLGVPTVLWWRAYGSSLSPTVYISFKEEMASAWAPPWSLTNGRYAPQIYGRCSVQSLVDLVQERKWYAVDRPIEFTENMTLKGIGEDSHDHRGSRSRTRSGANSSRSGKAGQDGKERESISIPKVG